MDTQQKGDVIVDVENLVWNHVRDYRATPAYASYRRHLIMRDLAEIRSVSSSPAVLKAIDKMLEEDKRRRLLEMAEWIEQGTRCSDEPLSRIAETSASLRYRDMEIKAVRPVRIFFCSRGRNAWHSTWIRRYSKKSMHSTAKSAFESAEEQRGPGNVFYVRELPALRVNLADVSILITEINSTVPMNWCLSGPHWVKALTSGQPFMRLIELCLERKSAEASEYENLILFTVKRDLYLSQISKGHEELHNWKSTAISARRYLNWDLQAETTDGSAALRIAQAAQMLSEAGAMP